MYPLTQENEPLSVHVPRLRSPALQYKRPSISNQAFAVVRSRSRIPNNTRSRSRIFLSDSGSLVGYFYITLLSWQFLLKWHNFLWNFCWYR